MNFTCNECNDTGSRDKLGTYLDCNACGTAATRRDLNDFVKSLGPTHPEDVALAIHQRALAMAPKQEAPQPAPEIRTVLRDALASGLTMAYGCSRVWSAWSVGTMSQDDFYPASECDDLLDELCDLAIAALRPDIAAPAAANGAMPELPEPTIDGTVYHTEHKICYTAPVHFTADQMRAYGKACAAAGPDAALVKSLDALLHLVDEFGIKSGVCCCGDDMARHSNPMHCGHSPVDSGEYYSAQTIEVARAALSGAKGN